MDPVGGEVRAATGIYKIADPDSAGKIMQLLNGYVAPGAADSVYQDVVCFLQPNRPTWATGEYLARFDQLRRRAESEMQTGRAPPGTLASALCARYASLSRAEKSLALASAQGDSEISAVRRMHRLFGSRGGAPRKDVLALPMQRQRCMGCVREGGKTLGGNRR